MNDITDLEFLQLPQRETVETKAKRYYRIWDKVFKNGPIKIAENSL